MAEYMNKTSEPGSDGVLLPAVPLVGQSQGYLYNWCRVLAGGGISQFSAITMRGPLVDVNGTDLTRQKFVLNTTNNTALVTYLAGEKKVTDLNGLPTEVKSGNLVRNTTNATALGCKNQTGATIVKAVARASLSLVFSIPSAPPSVVNVWLYKNGVQQFVFTPQFTVTAINDLYMVTGDFIVQNWANGEDIEFWVQSSAAGTVQIPDASLVVEVV